ncbi:RNA polymerase sigma factor [Nocardioides sp.]|uniref:RNA polymerase sigma factor n=1 Tax=Nocardioides sp. TaxID=35761 RepID=UPI003D0E9ED5
MTEATISPAEDLLDGGLDSASDTDLAALVRRDRSAAAFTALVDRHYSPIQAYACAIAHRRFAEDLTAESFARLWRKLSEGAGPTTAVRGYLKTIVRNALIDGHATEARLVWSEDLPEPSTSRDPGEESDDVVEALAMRDALARLAPRHRQVLELTVLQDRSLAETAVLMGLNPNATAALKYRACRSLRAALLAT